MFYPQDKAYKDSSSSATKHENSIFMLSPDFISQGKEEHPGLHKLFEDPDEKMQRIKTSIERSQIKKR